MKGFLSPYPLCRALAPLDDSFPTIKQASNPNLSTKEKKKKERKKEKSRKMIIDRIRPSTGNTTYIFIFDRQTLWMKRNNNDFWVGGIFILFFFSNSRMGPLRNQTIRVYLFLFCYLHLHWNLHRAKKERKGENHREACFTNGKSTRWWWVLLVLDDACESDGCRRPIRHIRKRRTVSGKRLWILR